MSIEPDIELTVDEDIVLWHSISRGDKKAFDDFFMKYYALLYGYSRYYVSAEDAKEVLQELMCGYGKTERLLCRMRLLLYDNI